MSQYFYHPATSLKSPSHPSRRSWGKMRRPALLLVSVSCLTGVVGYRFYNQPKLAVGTISPVTIIAPETAGFEDKETTENQRQKIRVGLVPVLKRDKQVTGEIQAEILENIQYLDRLRQIFQKYPLILSSSLSPATLKYILTCSGDDWQLFTGSGLAAPYHPTREREYALEEWQEYRQQVTPARLKAFQAQVNNFRAEYKNLELNTDVSPLDRLNEAVVFDAIRNISNDNDWQKLKNRIYSIANGILVQGIPPGIPADYTREFIYLRAREQLPPAGQNLGRELLNLSLVGKYNLAVDKETTQQQISKAVEAVETVKVEAKKGEIIVRAGDTIDRTHFVLLDGFGLSERGVNWTGLAATALIVTGSIVIFCLVARRVHRPLRHRDFLLLSLLSITPPLLALSNIPFTNLAAVALLSSSFYGPTLAVTQVLLTSGLSMFGINAITIDLIAGTAGGLLAAVIAGRLRSRDELALLGSGVGLVQGGVYLIGYLIVSAMAGPIVYVILPHAIVYGLAGLAWTIVALGLSPYLERLFDVVTPIRLVELSNPNGELLKRLATDAPGTFQHTLFVACLAEAAARKLHCNVELIRAGTLYHDIGKMHDPLGFIENQMGGPNKHDTIDDPYVSAVIIKKHVTEGIVMAKKYGLPRVIRDFIPEHQGTLLISYFYYQAKQQAEKTGETVNESHFRYDGPVPRSRETGIVMLADSSEAALRSLKDVSPEQAMDTIKKIFQARWRENQLVESGIRYEELPVIAEVFVQVWQQFHHQRIAYPKAVLDSCPFEKKSSIEPNREV